MGAQQFSACNKISFNDVFMFWEINSCACVHAEGCGGCGCGCEGCGRCVNGCGGVEGVGDV